MEDIENFTWYFLPHFKIRTFLHKRKKEREREREREGGWERERKEGRKEVGREGGREEGRKEGPDHRPCDLGDSLYVGATHQQSPGLRFHCLNLPCANVPHGEVRVTIEVKNEY